MPSGKYSERKCLREDLARQRERMTIAGGMKSLCKGPDTGKSLVKFTRG